MPGIFNYYAYTFTSAITPGPNNIMSLANGSRLGFRKALPFNFGVWAGFSIIAVVCTIFCSYLSSWVPQIELPIKIIGAVYMLYLAVKILKSRPDMENEGVRGEFWSGVLLQFVNPKIYLCIIVTMEGYIIPYHNGNWPLLIALALSSAFISFVCTAAWSAFGSLFRVLFSRHAKAVNAVMALLLAYCAASLFIG